MSVFRDGNTGAAGGVYGVIWKVTRLKVEIKTDHPGPAGAGPPLLTQEGKLHLFYNMLIATDHPAPTGRGTPPSL